MKNEEQIAIIQGIEEMVMKPKKSEYLETDLTIKRIEGISDDEMLKLIVRNRAGICHIFLNKSQIDDLKDVLDYWDDRYLYSNK